MQAAIDNNDISTVRLEDMGDLTSRLLCPKDGCHNNNLHHGRVKVINRDREDSDALAVAVDHHTVTSKRIPSKEAPGRRDGIEIEFSCEEHGPVGVLSIMQHKGDTLLEFFSDRAHGY